MNVDFNVVLDGELVPQSDQAYALAPQAVNMDWAPVKYHEEKTPLNLSKVILESVLWNRR